MPLDPSFWAEPWQEPPEPVSADGWTTAMLIEALTSMGVSKVNGDLSDLLRIDLKKMFLEAQAAMAADGWSKFLNDHTGMDKHTSSVTNLKEIRAKVQFGHDPKEIIVVGSDGRVNVKNWKK